MKNRLSKVLAAAGIASRRTCEEMIIAGRVCVNGNILLKPQEFVDSEQDTILVDQRLIPRVENKVYYILNKPKGYICSTKKIGRKKIVYELFQTLPYRLFSIGRLDRDTTGLLLMTNDGHFAQKVIHPSMNLVKEYLVKVTQEIEASHLKKIAKGMWIEGTYVRPAKVKKLRKGTLKIGVKEGKKREVRLLVAQSGLDLLSLKRIRIGGLHLGNLKEGAFRPLSEAEKMQIFQEAPESCASDKI